MKTPLIDIRQTLAANRNRITVELAKLEDGIFHGRVHCRFCGKSKADHHKGSYCHDTPLSKCFYAPEVDQIEARKTAISLLSQLSEL